MHEVRLQEQARVQEVWLQELKRACKARFCEQVPGMTSIEWGQVRAESIGAARMLQEEVV